MRDDNAHLSVKGDCGTRTWCRPARSAWRKQSAVHGARERRRHGLSVGAVRPDGDALSPGFHAGSGRRVAKRNAPGQTSSPPRGGGRLHVGDIPATEERCSWAGHLRWSAGALVRPDIWDAAFQTTSWRKERCCTGATRSSPGCAACLVDERRRRKPTTRQRKGARILASTRGPLCGERA